MTKTKQNQAEKYEAAKKRRKRDPKEKLAGYLYDLSKLTFAALVLGAFSPLISGSNIDLSVLIGGLISTVCFAIIANYLMKS